MHRCTLGHAIVALAPMLIAPAVFAGDDDALRVATFNTSLNRFNAGDLINDLATPDDDQARAVAEIIQRTAPDVVLINEFDYDEAGVAIANFRTNYLGVSQNGAPAIEYPFVYVAPSNTGIPSGFDLDNDGSTDGPGDAFGFGFFEGQFAMVLFSKHPILTDEVRTFQNLLWRDMPGALLPDDPDTPEPADWYSPEELDVVRLSSKSHWDVPVLFDADGEGGEPGRVVHMLCAHPTPPVFDGPEDRNGRRNHDEIRLWADYVTPGASEWITDDAGATGGLTADAAFVILGDYNADPKDGDSTDGAILQLLEHPSIVDPAPASLGGLDAAVRQNGLDLEHLAPASRDTADFNPAGPGNLRVDYALPSATLGVAGAGIFWPCEGDPQFDLVGPGFPAVSSDHRLVWVDVDLAGPAAPAADFPASYSLEFLGEAVFETGFVFDGTEVGGLSGIAFDPAIDAYRALSDDRGTINAPRFYALTVDLADGALTDGDVAFKEVLGLRDEAGVPFAALSVDPEGIAYSTAGDLFIASEGDANAGIDPFVDIFAPIGFRVAQLPVPARYRTSVPGTGIRNNLAFESLTLTPGEASLFTATENALLQDGPPATVEAGSPARILRYDLATDEAAEEYVYVTEPIADVPSPPGSFATNGLVELLAVDDDRLLAVERSFSVGFGNAIRIFEVDIAEADDVSALDSIDGAAIAPATKSLVLDLDDLGIVLDNIEGITFGPTLDDGRRTLVLVSDNNFNPAGQFTQFLAFAITPCRGDVDGDGIVGMIDLMMVLNAFGDVEPEAAVDVNGDGVVSYVDIITVLGAFGDCP